MRIALLTLGTRGDIQPYIALGKALSRRGHQVILGGADNFAAWVIGHGLEFRSLGVDMESFLQSDEARKALSGSPIAMLKLWRKTIAPLTQRTLYAIWEAARDAEVIVYHPKTAGAADVARVTGASLVYSAPFPIFPTPRFPFCILPGSYGPWLNRLSYKILAMPQLLFAGITREWRKKALGLSKESGLWSRRKDTSPHMTLLCAVSPALVPYGDWSESGVHTTGHWFLEEGTDWRPDAELAAFLEAGPPPVYIGFGSMPSKDPARLSMEILEGVRLAGARAILATGWGGLRDLETPDTVRVIAAAPHDALFRRVSAVVHHGGAGTTAAGLKAGLPTLICHSTFDQPYWGRRIHTLGLGPKPLALKRLRARCLASRLTDLLTNANYRKRAREMAGTIAREEGVEKAAEVIEGLKSYARHR